MTERPRSLALRLEWARAMNLHGRHEEAERLLMEGLREFPGSSALKNQLAFSYEGQQRWVDSVQMHASAVSMQDTVPGHLVDHVRALLACGRADEALPHAKRAVTQMPLDPRAIAYIGLCWRLLGDERDALLNDYEGFIQAFDVPVPSHCGDAAEFNERVAAILRTLHAGRRCSPERAIRGGTRSSCDLLGRGESEIRDLFAAFDQCLGEYVSRLPQHPSHPFLARPGDGFDFAASWSACLSRGGFHAMHVQSGAWISAMYCARTGDGSRAEIVFGQPDIDVGAPGAARRTVQIEAGRLVLFPSYLWHGTGPFGGQGERVDVCFDVIQRIGT